MPRNQTLGLNLLLLAALLAAPLSTFFQGVVRAEEEKKQKTELNRKMETIDEGMKKLKRTLKKPDQNEASLKLIEQILATANQCKVLDPAKAAKLPEADRKKFVDEYHGAMAHLIETMEQMKKAVADGDNKKALELHKSLKGQEEDGHDKFMESDDKDSSKDKDKDKDKDKEKEKSEK